MSVFDRPADRREGLMTDLYQLTMAAAYFENKLTHHATFEMSTRRLEAERGFYLACGLELVLDYLEGLSFTGAQIDYLRSLHLFKSVSSEFFEQLRALRFTGEVWALPEGTPFFPNEPVVQVRAPAIEAQLVETYLLSILNEQCLIASKAARVARAARGKHVSDFGTRRAHGPEAGQLVARAAFVGGLRSTSNVEAGFRLGIPVKGTFAHSWVMAWDREEDAFAKYHAHFPEDTSILLDTYDTLEAARKVVAMGTRISGVRLDSGDFLELSRKVREILDKGRMGKTRIIVSGDLNEQKIDALERAGAPIDIYGVGTELAVSKDMPALGGVYKLVEREGPHGETISTAKRSVDKPSLPGAKQVYRRVEGGRAAGDVLALAKEAAPAGVPLLEKVMVSGKRLRPSPSLPSLQERAFAELDKLPDDVRALSKPAAYPVVLSEKLKALAAELASGRT